MMSVLNNLRMVFKIGVIALLMGAVTVGLISYMASRMTAIDAAYADVVTRIETRESLRLPPQA